MTGGGKINGGSLLLGTALGAGVGAVLGWYISKRRYEKELDREIRGFKMYWTDKARMAADPDRDAGAEGSEATMADPDGVREPRVITKISDPAITLVLEPRHPALTGLEEVGAGEDPDEEDDGEDDDEDDSPPEPLVRDTTKPYVITAAEFAEENETYNKISVSYFALDDALCDERDAPIRDTSIVGVGFQELFSMENPVLHVRNDKLQVDFEITWREESFTESVLGYGKPK